MAMVIRDVCPRCQSPKYKKNGHIHNGKQNHQCKDCGRRFVDGFEQYLVSDETRSLVDARGPRPRAWALVSRRVSAGDGSGDRRELPSS
jgi:hypothetical protein